MCFLDPVHGARVVEASRCIGISEPGRDPPRDIEQLIPMLEADLRNEMRALVELPASMRQIRLIGCKDSRLLSRLALLEGVADQFEFITFGLPAREKPTNRRWSARRFGLNWVFDDRSNRGSRGAETARS